ncbi:MAG: OmpA family protein [Ignavibacteriales bacterium]|nr:OmpA family protein [Ignavibacteriales bacterium]
MKRFSTITILFSSVVFFFFTLQIFPQSDSEKMFQNARELSKKALAIAANIFAEGNFEKGTDLLADAEKLLKKNGKPEEIQQNLTTAIDLFNKSIETTKTLNTSFSDLMKIRQLAFNVDAYTNAPKLWKEGEENFSSAVENYNDKDMQGYQKYAKAAETNYKDAELVGVKGKFLNDLNASITQAEDKDLNKYAPVTLKKSKQFVQDIETILDANRYDTLKARNNLNQAMYELRHGLYFQDLFTKMKEKDKTMEDLVLSWEEPLTKIAAEFKIQSLFDKGYDEVTSQIVANINDGLATLDKTLKENQKLSSELDDLKKSIQDYKTKLADAETQNKKLNMDSESLKKSIEELNKSAEEHKTRFAQLENESLRYKTQSQELEKNNQIIEKASNLFLPSEAEVIRNGELIIIRLVNIVFPSNKATLEPQYYNLFAKVQKAIQLFSNGTTVIEGHTDGQGDFQKNLDLSQSRANAIFQYLMSNMGAEANRITAVGLGGTKPIANNSSEEGRAKNRRIEIVINPHFHATK